MPVRKPLADLIRPEDLSQFVGQKNSTEKEHPFYQIIKKHVPTSLLLWGPPGMEKTSLAQAIARELSYPLTTLNASIDNKTKLTQITSTCPYRPFISLVDEIRRMTTTLQGFLLPYLESRHILLIGATAKDPIMLIVPTV